MQTTMGQKSIDPMNHIWSDLVLLDSIEVSDAVVYIVLPQELPDGSDNPYPSECSPNSNTIWIDQTFRYAHAPLGGEAPHSLRETLS
ncbi:hypothetical protein TNCV_1176731 [Trichonephila clavipes]|nr:hypothetical protein TNCV_1176731 [Trichonephila clavipes]